MSKSNKAWKNDNQKLNGFMSQCFSQDELKEIIPTAEIERCSDIGWIVRIRKEKNV